MIPDLCKRKEIIEMANIKKNFVYQTVYQIMSLILPLITSPILARTLGAEGLGTYSYINTIVSYFILAANLGMYKYGIRSIAAVRDDKERLNSVFWEIWNLHKMISILIGIVYVGIGLTLKEYRLYYMIMFLSYIGGVININWLFFGIEEFKKIAIRDMIIKMATFILIVCFVRADNGLLYYFIVNAVGSLVANLIYWVMYKKYICKTRVNFKGTMSHLKPMLILFIPVLLETLYTSMDKVMLGFMCAKSEVGYYENADKALIARTIIYSITTVLMPRMANLLAKKDFKEFNRLMKQATGITMLLSSAFAFGTAAIAREFSVIFWGEDFVQCTNLIIVMAMAMPAVVLSREVREQYLIPANKDNEYILSAASGAIFNFIANAIMIPRIGAMGAAVATLLSEYIVLIVQLIVVKNELEMYKYIHGNEIYFLFGFIMFVFVRFIGQTLGIHLYSLFIEIFAGILLYGVFCCGYWYVRKDTYYLSLFFNMLKKIKK